MFSPVWLLLLLLSSCLSRTFFITFFAMGAALPPEPPCSTKTLIAYCGFLYGANATNKA